MFSHLAALILQGDIEQEELSFVLKTIFDEGFIEAGGVVEDHTELQELINKMDY